jgi:hypothetical protein
MKSINLFQRHKIFFKKRFKFYTKTNFINFYLFFKYLLCSLHFILKICFSKSSISSTEVESLMLSINLSFNKRKVNNKNYQDYFYKLIIHTSKI